MNFCACGNTNGWITYPVYYNPAQINRIVTARSCYHTHRKCNFNWQSMHPIMYTYRAAQHLNCYKNLPHFENGCDTVFLKCKPTFQLCLFYWNRYFSVNSNSAWGFNPAKHKNKHEWMNRKSSCNITFILNAGEA